MQDGAGFLLCAFFFAPPGKGAQRRYFKRRPKTVFLNRYSLMPRKPLPMISLEEVMVMKE